MCYKPTVFPNNKIIATVTHVGCTAHMLIPLPHFTSYCWKCREFHYVSLSSWQTVSFNIGIRSWNITLHFFSFLFPRGDKFSRSGPHNPFRHQILIQCFTTLFISGHGHIITQKCLNCMVQKCMIIWSELTNLRFLSCRRYQPQVWRRKIEYLHFYPRYSSALHMH